MAGLYFAWQEVEHLRANIPESVVVKDGRIVDWFYTSKAGFVMRHKQASVSLTKLRAKFEQASLEHDPPYAILSPFKGKPKLLLKSHYDTQVSLLLNETKAEPFHFVLQKFVPPARDALHTCTFSDGEVRIETTQFSQMYLINGLYSKAPPNKPQEADYIEHKLNERTMRIVMVRHRQFLRQQHPALTQVQVTWVCDEAARLWLLDIGELREGSHVVKPRSKPAYDLNLSFTRRPVSAKTSQKASTNSSFSIGARRESCRGVIPRPPPRSFKVSPRTQLLVRKENASSEPRIRLKDPLPEAPKPDLSREDPKSTASSRDSGDLATTDFWKKGYQDLETQLNDIKELHVRQLKELDLQWRDKCATLYSELMMRSDSEKLKLQTRVSELERQLEQSKEEEYRVEVFHSANHR